MDTCLCLCCHSPPKACCLVVWGHARERLVLLRHLQHQTLPFYLLRCSAIPRYDGVALEHSEPSRLLPRSECLLKGHSPTECWRSRHSAEVPKVLFLPERTTKLLRAGCLLSRSSPRPCLEELAAEGCSLRSQRLLCWGLFAMVVGGRRYAAL